VIKLWEKNFEPFFFLQYRLFKFILQSVILTRVLVANEWVSGVRERGALPAAFPPPTPSASAASAADPDHRTRPSAVKNEEKTPV
jgi:hypothetical protein